MRIALAALLASLFTQSPVPSLRIVVIEGEGAVNIIQQKTAVRPVVEVRDRNNLPVPGATVTFTVGSGEPAAFAGGAPTVTVTTNASGQATATGFNAVRQGAVQIQVSAAHQGQTAVTMISQTNFATAAAATAAGVAAGAAVSGGAAGGAATAGAAGGAAAAGGGISATTIAIVGGAVAGGAVVATQVKKEEGGGGGGDHYSGSFSAPYTFVNVGAASTCTFNRMMTGTLSIDLREDGTGIARISGTMNPLSFSGSCVAENTRGFSVPDGTVTGGPSAITFTTASSDLPITKATFTGSLSGSTITGQLTIEETTQTATGGQTFGGHGTGTATVTLTK